MQPSTRRDDGKRGDERRSDQRADGEIVTAHRGVGRAQAVRRRLPTRV